jgi:hypothetical protein
VIAAIVWQRLRIGPVTSQAAPTRPPQAPEHRMRRMAASFARGDAADAYVAARIISTSRTARLPQPSLPYGTSGRNFFSYKRKPIRFSSAGS